MLIKYYLKRYPIGRKLNEHVARTLVKQSIDLEGMIAAMLQEECTLAESDIRTVFSLLTTVLCDKLAEGHSVNLPFMKARPSIRGIFDNAADHFDERRHRKRVNCSAGPMLRAAVETAELEKVSAPLPPAPILRKFLDKHSRSSNSKLSPGGIGEIIGEQLKFNSNNAAEGVYLLHGDGRTIIKILELTLNREKKLIFGIPTDLPAGLYSLEVRRTHGKKGHLCSGTLSKGLVVVHEKMSAQNEPSMLSNKTMK